MSALRALTLNEADLSYDTLFMSGPPGALLRRSTPLLTGVPGPDPTVSHEGTEVKMDGTFPVHGARVTTAQASALKRIPQRPLPSTLSRMGVQAFVFEIQATAFPVLRKVRLLDTSPERAWSRLRTLYPHARPVAMTVQAG